MISILSTDTPHHRYFINRIIDSGISVGKIYFETTSVQPVFDTAAEFEKDMGPFEHKYFFRDGLSDQLPDVEIIRAKNINDAAIVEDLKKCGPKLGIVFGTRMIKPRVIDEFEVGLINVHRGIAQKYRGLDSDLWAIYHKDFGNIGVTIHAVDNSLDTGDIISQQCLAVNGYMKLSHLRYHTTVIATDLVIKAIREHLGGQMRKTKQREVGRYYSFMPTDLKRDVEKKFKRYTEVRR